MRKRMIPTKLAALVAVTLAAIASTASGAVASHRRVAATALHVGSLRIRQRPPVHGRPQLRTAPTWDPAVEPANQCSRTLRSRGRAWREPPSGSSGRKTVRRSRSRPPRPRRSSSRRSEATVVIGEDGVRRRRHVQMAQSVTIQPTTSILRVADGERSPDPARSRTRASCSGRTPRMRSRARVLAGAALSKFGKGAKINVGTRSARVRQGPPDTLHLRVEAISVERRNDNVLESRPARLSTPPNTTISRRRRSRGMGGLIASRSTFEKFAPSLVRSGKWSASKTLAIEALRNADTLDKIGAPVKGLSSTAGRAAGGPAGKAFAAYLEEEHKKGTKAYTRLRGHRVRRGDDRLPGRGARLLPRRRRASRRTCGAVTCDRLGRRSPSSTSPRA